MDVPLGGHQRAPWYIHDSAQPPGGLVRGLVVYLGAGRIGLDRLDSLEGRFLALVGLAGRNDLAVPGLQVEVELAAGAHFQNKLARHRRPLVRIRILRYPNTPARPANTSAWRRGPEVRGRGPGTGGVVPGRQ